MDWRTLKDSLTFAQDTMDLVVKAHTIADTFIT